jgi:hypothetical protein
MRVLLILLFTAVPLLGQAANFRAWPADLPTFHFTRSDVAEHWQYLTGGKRGPFPTAATLKEEAARYPSLMLLTQNTVRANRSHPRLRDLALDWSDQDYEIAAAIIADAWVALFNGDFARAWELGQLVGPPGHFPALYALALHAQYIEPDPAIRINQLDQVILETRTLLQQAPDHLFLQFGHAYAKSRRLEPMGMLEARNTGFLEEILAALEKLDQQDPDNLYTVTLRGAVYAGTLEKAGTMLARMTYRIRPAMVDEAFADALKLNTHGYAAPMLEYAIALEKIGGKDRRDQIVALLKQAANAKADSAEAALHQRVAITRLAQYR